MQNLLDPSILSTYLQKKANNLNIALQYLLLGMINKKLNNKEVYLIIKTDFGFKI